VLHLTLFGFYELSAVSIFEISMTSLVTAMRPDSIELHNTENTEFSIQIDLAASLQTFLKRKTYLP
jgi:hypothetical protein